jgi:hypothetical protein
MHVCTYVRMYVCMHDIYLQTLLVVLDVRRESTLHVCVCVCVCVLCVCREREREKERESTHASV